MSYSSLFIYQIESNAAIYVVIGSNVEDAKSMIPCNVDLKVTKLGCVTADVHDVTVPGIVTRAWK